jgi:hypothetical protein
MADDLPASPAQFGDALKTVAAVHFTGPNAITAVPEMYNASLRKEVIGSLSTG